MSERARVCWCGSAKLPHWFPILWSEFSYYHTFSLEIYYRLLEVKCSNIRILWVVSLSKNEHWFQKLRYAFDISPRVDFDWNLTITGMRWICLAVCIGRVYKRWASVISGSSRFIFNLWHVPVTTFTRFLSERIRNYLHVFFVRDYPDELLGNCGLCVFYSNTQCLWILDLLTYCF